MLRRWIKRLYQRLFRGRWVVVRTIWPYAEGYGTYNKKHRILLDSGLTYEQAVLECEKLNNDGKA